jgi:hypothetical protein
MALQHYDVLDPQRPGHFIERHWLPRNTPVFDAQGQLRYIIHSSVNVTEEVQARRAMAQAQGREQEALVEVERERQRLSQLVLQARRPYACCRAPISFMSSSTPATSSYLRAASCWASRC